MKAKVKATNTIHNVIGIDLLTSGLGEPIQDITTFSPEDIELTEQDTTPCDLWEDRRFQASCYAMNALLGMVISKDPNESYGCLSFDAAAQLSVKYADALINELKKQE